MSDVTHRDRAEIHKPLTKEGIAAAASEMLRNGLTEYDAAHVLRLDVQQVRRLIAEQVGWQ